LEEAETQQLSQPHELMLFTYSELQKKHFCRKNGGGKENSPNFIHLLRHFSLHKVTKLRTVTSSVNHFDSLHRKSGLGLMMGNSLKCTEEATHTYIVAYDKMLFVLWA